MSALGDRIKIARNAEGEDINLSIQYILNCGGDTAGSCHGGSHTGAYEFVKESGFVPLDTCLPYIACSEESTEGFCEYADTTCSSMNICKTCDTFAGNGGACTEIDIFPNATIGEYGTYNIFSSDRVHKIKAEIFARGPVAAGVNAEPLVAYKGGIVQDHSFIDMLINHIVSIVGWGKEDDTEYWIVRNSWGQVRLLHCTITLMLVGTLTNMRLTYMINLFNSPSTTWAVLGRNGLFPIETGYNALGIESEVAWATPGSWTTVNYPCSEDGKNCGPDAVPHMGAQTYVDPSKDIDAVKRRVQALK
eukprot:CAMPEP_0178689666 /NCGR_PEP_ID=MMETSP0699-20121125/5664_1 /TAXON_ID=265572 /ORGANISM="Extubocellulus spinifer, Strain CCMP396" /LENGTH=304 /DNA_ID=CAMNT_0020334753 /DNA_START=831 /DNA_END=1749 /DNA_ORIENTATION=+